MATQGLSKRRWALFLGDILIILFAFSLALWLRTGKTLLDLPTLANISFVVFLVVVYGVSFSIFELYDFRKKFRSPAFLPAMGGAFGLAYLAAVLGSYFLRYRLGRGVFFISWILTAVLVYAWRYLYSGVFKLSEPRRNVLILGNGETTETVIPGLQHDPEFRLAAIMDKRVLKEMLETEFGADKRSALEEYVALNRINDIVVSFEAVASSEMERALVNCRMKGIGCYTFEAFYERLFEKLPILMLNDRWFLMSGGFGTLGNRLYNAAKRTVDIAVASVVLLATLPISAVIALLIPLTSRGPAFFTQDRLGAGKVPFKIVKFRTMVRDAEADGPQWANSHDLRVTRLGGFLRKTRLDELPQLLNVLKGEMSLIGPRPEREFFVTRLTEKIPFYALRFFIKPGITGWAQVNFHYGSNDEDALEKLRYELYYIKHRSLVLDTRILLRTVRVILTGQGT